MVRLALVLGVLAVAAYTATAGDDPPPAGRKSAGQVVRVVDGDTIHVQVGGRREKVRYIGVDTPESVKPGAPVECFAKRASAFNQGPAHDPAQRGACGRVPPAGRLGPPQGAWAVVILPIVIRLTSWPCGCDRAWRTSRLPSSRRS